MQNYTSPTNRTGIPVTGTVLTNIILPNIFDHDAPSYIQMMPPKDHPTRVSLDLASKSLINSIVLTKFSISIA